MPVFTESTHLTENVEPFRNVCGMWVYIKTRCMSPRYYHPASTAFTHNSAVWQRAWILWSEP